MEEFAVPRKVLVTTHQGPDGDAMGASLAVYLFLKKQGHDVSVATPNDYPDFLQWLPGNDSVFNYMKQKPLVEQLVSEAEYIFHIDYNHIKRSADMTKSLSRAKAIRILIDHHIDPSIPVKYLFSDVEASSSCELLFQILQLWDEQMMDLDIATCIYTGIMTDTGCFAYRSATPLTFEIASKLLAIGVDRGTIYDNVYNDYSASRMRLMGYCLNKKMEVFPEYKTAFISLTLEEQEQYDFVSGDSEGFVNLPLSIKGIRFTAFFLEKDGKIKISFRSKGYFSVNDFARKHFSGGGHLNAAGGESTKKMDAAIQEFRDLLPLYSDELNRS